MSTSTPSGVASKMSTAVAGSIGNFFEFYNFVAYSFFTPMIGATFFPGHDSLSHTLGASVAFGVGFLARPLGALLIGRLAENRGNKAAMILTLSLMTVGALTLTLTPGYATLGIAAPFIITLARLLQGFSEGGEIGPATDFLHRLGSGRQAGAFAAMQPTTQLAASLCAVVIGVVLSFSLSHDALFQWGWRIPFALGLLIAPVGLYLRARQTAENTTPAEKTKRPPVDPINVALVFLIVTCGTIMTYLRSAGVSYAVSALHLSPRISLETSAIGMGVGLIASVIAIWAFLRFNPWWLLLPCGIAYALAIFPAYAFAVRAPGIPSQIALNIVANLGSGTLSVLMYALMLAAIPAGARAFVFGLAYTLAVSVFGGATQPVILWAIQQTHNPMMPGYLCLLVVPVLVLTLIVLARRTRALQNAAL